MSQRGGDYQSTSVKIEASAKIAGWEETISELGPNKEKMSLLSRTIFFRWCFPSMCDDQDGKLLHVVTKQSQKIADSQPKRGHQRGTVIRNKTLHMIVPSQLILRMVGAEHTNTNEQTHLLYNSIGLTRQG